MAAVIAMTQGLRAISALCMESSCLVTWVECWPKRSGRPGHAMKTITVKTVFPFRQGHKADENDTLSIYSSPGSQW